MASSPITSWQIQGEKIEAVISFLSLGSKIIVDGECSHEIRRCLLLGRKVATNLESVLKSRGITLPTNVRIVKVTVFPVVMYGCESWTVKKAEHWRIDAFIYDAGEDSWGSHRQQEDQTNHLKGNQPWIPMGRTDADVETPVFWSSDANSWLIGKVPDAGKDWGQKEKRVSENEMAGWYHQCKEHELGQTLGDREGQRGLMCCSPWGHKESDVIGQLNDNNNNRLINFIYKVYLVK